MKMITTVITATVLLLVGCSATKSTASADITTETVTVSITEPVSPSRTPAAITKTETETVTVTASSDDATSTSASNAPTALSDQGTRSNPVPAGITGYFGDDWSVTVGKTDVDAWPEIKAETSYAEAPTDGVAYVAAEVTASYTGSENADPGRDLSFAFVGAKGNVFDSLDYDCGFGGPDGFYDMEELYAGATGTATLCISVPIDQIDGGAWRIQYLDMKTFERTEGFFALS